MSLCFAGLNFAGVSVGAPTAVMLTMMSQSAVSVVGWSQMSKAVESGVRGYDTELAFDVIGFSMPITVALQASAGILQASYVAALGVIGGGMLCVSGVIRMRNVREFQKLD